MGEASRYPSTVETPWARDLEEGARHCTIAEAVAEVRASVAGAIAASGGEWMGRDEILKSPESARRKRHLLYGEGHPLADSGPIEDSIRFTAVLRPTRFTWGVRRLMSSLCKGPQGRFDHVALFNRWQDANRVRDFQLIVRDRRSGLLVEVLVVTPSALEHIASSHGLYQEMRRHGSELDDLARRGMTSALTAADRTRIHDLGQEITRIDQLIREGAGKLQVPAGAATLGIPCGVPLPPFFSHPTIAQALREYQPGAGALARMEVRRRRRAGEATPGQPYDVEAMRSLLTGLMGSISNCLLAFGVDVRTAIERQDHWTRNRLLEIVSEPWWATMEDVALLHRFVASSIEPALKEWSLRVHDIASADASTVASLSRVTIRWLNPTIVGSIDELLADGPRVGRELWEFTVRANGLEERSARRPRGTAADRTGISGGSINL